ncbi:Zn-dependent protease (includes SpoIVFB) [Ruminococcus sp. YE71]|uniref:site-2 protease family protein n=1 Tax=unclassified Ruminococcus TaxID=2608920 RepID=UPI000881AD9C|nr:MULTISPECIES: site-2 protease family protein [unclassified Ruminococcus]SDA15728.1 Zn-dependent protease (includes SpoIVFB) [Ruminococcus sp. YE78]SFW23084.1 Zn-dependent protease (includes SpoIVFB) [Ruminococcus sp. YE71]
MISALQTKDKETIIISLFVYLMIILLITPIHEFAHAWAAYKLGDDTAKLKGRLTLNPIASIDPFGTLGMLLFGFGWGKPVPVNPLHFKNYRKGMALTAAAGPISNLIVAFVGMIAMKFSLAAWYVHPSDGMSYLYTILNLFTRINIGLAVFNLIPVFPLDGQKILAYFTPKGFDEFMARNQMFMTLALFALMMSPVLGKVREVVYFGLDKLTFFIDPIANAVFGIS